MGRRYERSVVASKEAFNSLWPAGWDMRIRVLWQMCGFTVNWQMKASGIIAIELFVNTSSCNQIL